ncbi:MAG TPA: PDGLE domain-containing protein [bacterium]|nr:PDGLE domain-containing protein [bacterium]
MKRLTIVLIVLGALALVAALASPLASPYPDGLEAALERATDEGAAAELEEGEHLVDSPWPDYDAGGDGSTGSTILAGILGAIATLALGLGLAKLVSLKKA